jgi:threonine dehydratase
MYQSTNSGAAEVPDLVTLDDIRAAAARVREAAVETPLLTLDLPGHDGLRLKCENVQPIGAFKIRGAYNMIAQLPADRRARGVITYSSGNHGQAVAFAAKRLGAPAVIVMPTTAPKVKVEGVRSHGADVIFEGTTSVDRQKRAEAEASARGLTIVPPFDHPWIIAGQGTLGLELLEQVPDVRAVFVPVGGGGLVSGVAAAIKQSNPAVRLIGVEPAGAAKMAASLAAGRVVTLDHTASIADGLLPLAPGQLTFAHVRAFVDEMIAVEEEEIIDATLLLFRQARIVVEPSGAASVAGVLRRTRQQGAGLGAPVVAVISGGNVALETLTELAAQRAAAR